MSAMLQNFMPLPYVPAPWNISGIRFVSQNPSDAVALATPVREAGLGGRPAAPYPPTRYKRPLQQMRDDCRMRINGLFRSYFDSIARGDIEPRMESGLYEKELYRKYLVLTKHDSYLKSLMRLHDAPFDPIERHPDLVRFACACFDGLDRLRAEHDLRPFDRAGEYVRLVEAGEFDRAADWKSDDGPLLGVYDWVGAVTFLRYEEGAGFDAPRNRVRLLGVLSHELVHAGMMGIGAFSHMLNEGITDRIAHDIAVPFIVSAYGDELLSEIPPEDAALYIESLLPGFFHQAVFMSFVKRDLRETYDALVHAALTGDHVGAREAIARRFGPEVADLMASDMLDWRHILERIR